MEIGRLSSERVTQFRWDRDAKRPPSYGRVGGVQPSHSYDGGLCYPDFPQLAAHSGKVKD
jgi:hypothetical protein